MLPARRSLLAIVLVACGGGSGPPATASSSGEEPAPDGGAPASGPRLEALDPSFGTNGETTFELGAVDARAHDVVLAADGKIVVAGSLGDGQTQPTRSFVARLTAEGALDTSFGAGKGFVVMEDDPYPPRLSLENGRPLLMASGKLRRFANDGTVEAEVDERLRAFTESDDGTVIGVTSEAILRFTSDLTRISTFGDGGSVPVTTSSIFDVLRVPGGFVVASDGDATLTKYDASGVVDTAFGDAGTVRVDDAELHRVTLLGSRIVVVGARERQGSSLLHPFAIVFGMNGQVDLGFASGGALTTPNAGSFGDPVALPDGRLFVLENMPFATSVVRFSEAGALVSATSVASTNPLSTMPAWTGTALAVDAAGSGKVVVAGNVQDPPDGTGVRKRRVWVARFAQ